MRRPASRLFAAALAGLSSVALVACGDDGGTNASREADTATTTAGDGSPAPRRESSVAVLVPVEVRDGAVVGGVERVEVSLRTPVRIEVTSDVADHVHVHGYDLFADVTPEQPGVVEFEADIPGVFEVELEGAGLPLLELLVR